MSKLAATAMNAVPSLLLRSPLHRLMSRRYLLLTFTGRKTGRHYTTPVAYVRDGDHLVLSTDSPWGANVIGGRAVTVLLGGRSYPGVGRRLTDPAQSEPAMRRLLALPGYARAAGIRRTRTGITAEQVHQAAAHRIVVTIELGNPS